MFKKQEPKFVDSKKLEEDPEIEELEKKIQKIKNSGKQVENQVPVPIQEDNQEQEGGEIEESEVSQVNAVIVSSELLESGKIRTIIISNSPFGMVGSSFEL